MKFFSVVIAFSLTLFAEQPPSGNAGPKFAGESLRYNVNWPSGLSLGDGQLSSRKTSTGWAFSFQLEANVPGFAVTDRFQSAASEELCSILFEKEFAHGKKKSREKIAFDSARGVATRETIGGGKTDLPAPSCARDAVAYVYHVRNELAQGRIPAAQPVFYGASYQIRLEYTGTQRLRLTESVVEADRMVASIKGPASEHTIEIFFARDGARTPVLVRVPTPLGPLAMELVR